MVSETYNFLSNKKEPVAHSPNDENKWHTLEDHLKSTGELAAQFGKIWGGENYSEWLGLTHDVGKIKDDWQLGLRNVVERKQSTINVKHKSEGATLASLIWDYNKEWVNENLSPAHLATSIILGHHNKIPNFKPGENEGKDDPFQTFYLKKIDNSKRRNFRNAIQNLAETVAGNLNNRAQNMVLPSFVKNPENSSTDSEEDWFRSTRVRLDVFGRMSHSTLVDADYLDTEKHFSNADKHRLNPVVNMADLFDCFQRQRNLKFVSRNKNLSGINRVREELYDASIEKASCAPGFFRLPAPTGSGKTISAAAFALKHAAVNNMRRVIIAVPFTSITTQNAAVYRSMLEPDGETNIVLEHHSSILDSSVSSNVWRRTAATNWDAPFIVTTTVQLLESLFSNKPSVTRKLHRIAGSVIVLDEVQALPVNLIPSILLMLRELVENYSVSVVFSTATQPSFFDMRALQKIPFTDIIENKKPDAILSRVEYDWRKNKYEWEDIAKEIADFDRVLVIVNTTKEAQNLHSLISAKKNNGSVFCLSTRMCASHRETVLNKVREILHSGDPVTLVSTQLIEAGVDVDFPVVYRALAPADSVIQAAGRCNREGRLETKGKVIIFDPVDGKKPGGDYKISTDLTEKMFITENSDIENPVNLDRYYHKRYQNAFRRDINEECKLIEKANSELNFLDVQKKFKMINDTTIPVVVSDYGTDDDQTKVRSFLDKLRNFERLSSSEWKHLQKFTASIPEYQGRLVPVIGHDSEGVREWNGIYDIERGIEFDNQSGGSIW